MNFEGSFFLCFNEAPTLIAVFLEILWDHSLRGKPKTLIHTQSLSLSFGQQSVVGLHRSRFRLIFFQTHVPGMTCSVATSVGKLDRKCLSFITKTLTLCLTSKCCNPTFYHRELPILPKWVLELAYSISIEKVSLMSVFHSSLLCKHLPPVNAPSLWILLSIYCYVLPR